MFVIYCSVCQQTQAIINYQREQSYKGTSSGVTYSLEQAKAIQQEKQIKELEEKKRYNSTPIKNIFLTIFQIGFPLLFYIWLINQYGIFGLVLGLPVFIVLQLYCLLNLEKYKGAKKF